MCSLYDFVIMMFVMLVFGYIVRFFVDCFCFKCFCFRRRESISYGSVYYKGFVYRMVCMKCPKCGSSKFVGVE